MEARLPAGGQATPMTYEVNGKQYVVISAGGHGSFGTKMGDYIVAYALPDDANKTQNGNESCRFFGVPSFFPLGIAAGRRDLNREPQHHPGVFMFQQVAVCHIGKLLRRRMIKLH